MNRRKATVLAAMLALAAPVALGQKVKPACADDTRKCMIIAATSYLDGLIHHDGSKVLLAPDVVRTEQGHDAGRGEAFLRNALDHEPPMLGYANTRFIVDEASRQVVYYTLLRLSDRADQLPPGTPAGPMTVHLAERFRIERGLITEIEAIFTSQAGTIDGVSGWPDER